VGSAGPPFRWFNQRGLLTGDISARDDAEPHACRRSGEPAAFRDGRRDGVNARRSRLADAHDQLIGSDGLRRELAAVEHQVRQQLTQRAVLEARRLPLGGVDHDDRAPPRGGDGAQLGGRRKATTAAAAQARTLDPLDQLGGRAPAALRPPISDRREAAVDVQMLVEAQCSAVRGDTAQQPRQRRRGGLPQGGRTPLARAVLE